MSNTKFEFDTSIELPDGWEWIPLDELMEEPKQDIVDGPFGSNLKASEYVDEGVPIARLQNVNRNTFIHKNIKFVTHDKAAQLARHTFKSGDILITKLGDPLGKACIAPVTIDHGVIVADLVRVRPSQRKINRQYLTYAINSPLVARQFEMHTKGTTRPRVNLGMIRQLPIPVAPQELQEAVVAEIEKQFSRLDEAVASLKRVKANLKRYKAAVLKAAVQGRLVETEAEIARREGRSYETGEHLLHRILETLREQWQGRGKYKEPVALNTTDLPELPEGWVWSQLENAVSGIVVGYVGPVKEHIVDRSNTRFISTTHVGENEFIEGELRYVADEFDRKNRKSSVVPGDILIARHGDSGKACLVPEQIPRAQVSNAVIVHPNLEVTNPVYLMYAINATRRELQKRKVGGVQQVVNTKSMGAFSIPIPPRPEQDEIVKEIESRLSVLRETEIQVDANLKRAECMRQSIFTSAFSGKFR